MLTSLYSSQVQRSTSVLSTAGHVSLNSRVFLNLTSESIKGLKSALKSPKTKVGRPSYEAIFIIIFLYTSFTPMHTE